LGKIRELSDYLQILGMAIFLMATTIEKTFGNWEKIHGHIR